MSSALQMTGSQLSAVPPVVASSALQMTGSQLTTTGPAIWPGRYRFIAASNTWRRHVRYRYNLATSSWIAYEYGAAPPPAFTYMSVYVGPAGVTSAISSLSIAATASGVVNSMPVGNLPTFTQIVAQDYNTPIALNDASGANIETVYPGHKAYDNFQDTSKNGWYDKSPKTVYVANSNLILNCHWDTVLGRPSVAYVAPNGYTAQQYGKWTWRMRAPVGANVMEYKIVPLFWPGSNVFGDGEWDFPENGIGSITDVQINLHTATVANASQGNGTTVSGIKVSDWHTYDVEWTPTQAKFSIDGIVRRTITSSSIAWPPGTFRWGLQSECANLTVGSTPPATTSLGVVYVDWFTQYTYTP